MKQKIKTIFFGTPSLAATGLELLLQSDFFDILAVVTQIDKSSGRNLQLQKSAVKIKAEEHGLKILQAKKLNDLFPEIEALKPDLIIVIAYGQILKENILNLPKFKCVNVHGSLLPKYRGASCLQASILAGDKKTGITLMQMDEGLDTGPIIISREIILDEQETTLTLMNKMKKTLQENLVSDLKKYINGEFKIKKQDDSQASYAPIIKKEDGNIDPQKENANQIERKIRAYTPWPGSFLINKKYGIIKILEVAKLEIEAQDQPAGKFFIHNNELALKCQDRALIIKKIQIAGKKPLNSSEFLKGNSWILN